MIRNMMKYICLAAVLLAFSSCSVEEPMASGEGAGSEKLAPVPGELMVKFTPEVTAILEEAGIGAPLTRSGVVTVDEVLGIVGEYELERIFPKDQRTEQRTSESELNRWYMVRFSKDIDVNEVKERLSKLSEVTKTSFVRTIKRTYRTGSKAMPLSGSAAESIGAAAAGYPFNDDLLPVQWNIINRGDLFPGVDGTINKAVYGADVQCEEAWKMSTGDPSIIVAVLDEGIFIDHPDLKENIWVNEDEVRNSKTDNDGNGYTGDVHGYNFVKDCGIISWDDVNDTGHATHVAGVIAAQNDNGIGLASIAGGTPSKPGVKLMSCQIFLGDMATTTYSSVKAIKYAADNGATVLQCSWGYTSGEANVYDWGAAGFADEEEWAENCPLEKEVLDYFIHRAGSPNGPIEGGIAVFASGNEYAPAAGFPGAASKCVSVAATAADFTPAVYSNYGTGTTISAPGGDQNYYYEYFDDKLARGELGCILSSLPFNVSESGYGYMEGTSMACPHVSGVVALGLSYAVQLHKHFTADEFRELLYSSVTPIDSYMSGTKDYYRYVADVGLNHPMQFDMGAYRNKMGAGQVNATKLLQAIGQNGTEILFPNLTVSLGADLVVIPSNYFNNGSTSFTVSVKDQSIASASLNGDKLIIKGLKAGITQASITGGGKTQNFNITVRTNAGTDTWL